MKNLRLLIFFAFQFSLCAFQVSIHAQDVIISFDNKVIQCDSLNMPDNTSANELLNLLPELLQRPGDVPFPTYQLLVNGMPLSEGKDQVLSQLRIVDLDQIVVNESPLTSYLQNGEGGSINLILRSGPIGSTSSTPSTGSGNVSGTKSSKIWGSADVAVGYPLDVTPQVLIGHSSGKWMIRGLFLGDVYNNSYSTNMTTFDATGAQKSSSTTDLENRYRCQLARAYFQYNPGARDVLQLNVSETYKYKRLNGNSADSGNETSSSLDKATTLHTYFNWNHTFSPRMSLLFQCQYIYNPSVYHSLSVGIQKLDEDFDNNTVAGKIEFTTALLSAASKKNLNLSVGCNLNGVFYSADIIRKDYLHSSSGNENPQNNTYFAQPYLSFVFSAGKFQMKVNGEFQHFAYKISGMSKNQDRNSVNVSSNDFTGKLITEYHFTSHHDLRLIVDRKLYRPTNQQVFPFLYFNLQGGYYSQGNPDLSPILSHEVRIDYISDYKWGEHSLMLDVSSSYNNISNIITSYLVGNSGGSGGHLGTSLRYYTYRNQGTSNIFNANLMALYSYKVLSLSLTGNVYHSGQNIAGATDHRTYFDLAFFCQFRLKDGWQGSAKMTYYSKVNSVSVTYGDCAVANMSIGRRWKNLFVYAYDQIVLQKKARDCTYNDDGSFIYQSYQMVPNIVGVGIKYSF